MNIPEIIKDRQRYFTYKNILPIKIQLDDFLQEDIKNINTQIDNTVKINGTLNKITNQKLQELLISLKPWRKGPFEFFDTFIDSEWKSFIKYDLIEPYLDIKDKIVMDIGCNNGYYLFKMISKEPKQLIGFDPSASFYMQFCLANHFIKSSIKYELLGIEHVSEYVKHNKLNIDTIVCLGVLYHRIDPIGSLKILSKSLKKGGTLILDSFIIDGEEEMSLSPKDTYSKIPNIYFIPTINALKNWLYRSGFDDIKVIAISQTNNGEQRATPWIDSQSLEHFTNNGLTTEGYAPPKRGYVICTKC